MRINLIPYGGLGNRMRTISSVYKYAQENGHELVVYWNRQKDFNQSFSNLFKRIDNLKVVDRVIGFNHNNPYKLNLFIPLLFDKILNRKSHYFIKEKDLEPIMEEAVKNNQKEITISSCYQHGEMFPLDKLFIPNDNIYKTINETYKLFSKQTIGVHIRRTDNIQSINFSKPEMFEKKINTLFEENSDAKVFLCTDDHVIKNELKTMFGNRIITYDSKLNRYSPKGINDAVVELFLLAKTNVIWGSFNSSYTDIASKIYNIERIIVTE